mmetsp:Transcript_40923/g.61832  ORF Transcript_40923/g.61832 Transcript_40923/m.61832 type:complete len:105 (+) Transcript_40923:95-409(+)
MTRQWALSMKDTIGIATTAPGLYGTRRRPGLGGTQVDLTYPSWGLPVAGGSDCKQKRQQRSCWMSVWEGADATKRLQAYFALDNLATTFSSSCKRCSCSWFSSS